MKVKCKYCGKEIENTRYTCNYCGGPVEQAQRSSVGEPQTIEELKQWYKEHKLPPENVTRFFIGKSVKEPKAFGIYYDGNTGDYVVYKNKADGSKAIRYKGKDEKYAVNELYQKLKEEVLNQKNANKSKKKNNNTNSSQKRSGSSSSGKGNIKKTLEQIERNNRSRQYRETYIPPVPESSGKRFLCKLKKIAIITVSIIAILALFNSCIGSTSGYYDYDGKNYYFDWVKDDWYLYDEESESWQETTDLDDELLNNRDEYYEYSLYHNDSEYSDVKDSWAYKENQSSSSSSSSSSWYDDDDYYYDDDDDDWGSDWDNDYSWDSSDSWDSSSSDWDSDW